MRYRALTATGDSTIFSGNTMFLVNSPAAVAQAISTRLKLWQGQWFLDTTLGMPWMQQVIGKHTQSVRDAAIQNTILGTPGVNQIVSYSSTLNGRALSVVCVVDTIYGPLTIASQPPPAVPVVPPGPTTGPALLTEYGSYFLLESGLGILLLG